MTAILLCTCKHAYQDKAYGHRRRIFNSLKADGKFRCTVCGDTKTRSTQTISISITKKSK